MAAYSLLVGVKLKDVLPRISTRQQILAKYGLAAHGRSSIRISGVRRMLALTSASDHGSFYRIFGEVYSLGQGFIVGKAALQIKRQMR